MGKRRLLGAITSVLLVASLVSLSAGTPAAGAGATISVSAAAQILTLGDSADFTVALSHNGSPMAGSSVQWMVLTGPDIGTGGTAVSDATGAATFSYDNSGGTGIDQIRAKVVDPDGDVAASEPLALYWVGAVPATMELSQTGDSSAVGTENTVTAAVTDAGGNPVVGVDVVLRREGTGTPAFGQTDSAGLARFSFTSEVPGDEVVTAEVTSSSPLVTATLTKTWTPVGALVFGPDDSTKTVGVERRVAVTATDAGGVPVAGAEVAFTVRGANPFGADVVADGSGVAVLDYTGTEPGVDAITAAFVDPDGNHVTSAQMIAAWVPAVGTHLVLTSLEPQDRVGVVHTFYVVAGVDGAALPGADTSLHGGSSAPFPFVATTDERGLGSFSYGADRALTETFTASFDDAGTAVTSDPVAVEFVRSYDILLISYGTPLVGTQHTATVLVTGPDGLPVAGAPLSIGFFSWGFPNYLLPTRLVTDATGRAAFTFVGFLPGVASIAANLLEPYYRFASGGVTFVEAELALSPVIQPGYVGSHATVTATLATATGEVSGIPVDFEITSGPGAGAKQTVNTDSAGKAAFTYAGANLGSDTVEASAVVDGVKVTALTPAHIMWLPAVPTTLTLTLAPESGTNPVGAAHTVTATLLDGDAPVEGVEVAFEVQSGPNAGEVSSSATDGAGQAAFTYTGDGGAGTDTIVAAVTVDDTTLTSNAVTKEWVGEPPALSLVLGPESASNPVATEHELTATLAAGGSPVPGVEIGFEVTAGPQAGVKGTGTTDESGIATFTYFGDRGGIDTIVATAEVDGVDVVSNPVTKTWVLPVPAVVRLTPEFSENPVGTEHTVSATVSDSEGLAVPEVEVTFTVTAGPNAGKSATMVTTTTGTAWFTYTGDGGAGTDTIVASVDVDGTPLESNQVTKTWLGAEVADAVHLKALWGPAGHRSLAYENGGSLTGGDYVVDPATGEPRSIDGTGTLPSSSGSGDATIAFHLTFDAGRNMWSGTVEVDDPSAGFAAKIPVFAGPQRITRDGDTITGTLFGIKKLTIPLKCFELHFTIVDAGSGTAEPPADDAGGHLRFSGGHGAWAPWFRGIHSTRSAA